MGQRLNIEVISKGKQIAGVYMHWSAYSDCAAHILRDLIESFRDINEIDLTNRKEILARLKEALPGAELEDTEEELEAEDIFDFKEERIGLLDRSSGLISFTEKGMAATRDWEEGRISIDIETKDVLYDVFFDDVLDNFISEGHEYEDFCMIMNDDRLDDWMSYDSFNKLFRIFKLTDFSCAIATPNRLLSFIE